MLLSIAIPCRRKETVQVKKTIPFLFLFPSPDPQLRSKPNAKQKKSKRHPPKPYTPAPRSNHEETQSQLEELCKSAMGSELMGRGVRTLY